LKSKGVKRRKIFFIKEGTLRSPLEIKKYYEEFKNIYNQATKGTKLGERIILRTKYSF